MKNKNPNLILFIILFFLFNNLNAQSIIQNNSVSIRTSDLINFQSNINIRKISLYHPVASVAEFDTWDSPGVNYYVNGYKKELFPLNLKTVDFLPANILTTEIIQINNPDLSNPYGDIKIIQKEIPKTKQLAVHLFLGGETGDPMHHVYTKSNTINRNKILPSGEFAYSNRNEKISYSIFGGFYGYFTQQDQNSKVAKIISPENFSEPNKNFFVGSDFNYYFDNQDFINVMAGLSYFSAFDITPSIPFMNYINSSNLYFFSTYYNSYFDIKFKVKLENLNSEIEGSEFYSLYENDIQKIVFSAEKSFTSNNWKLNLYSNLNYLNAQNEKSSLLKEDLSEFGFEVKAQFNYQLDQKVNLYAGSLLERKFSNNNFNIESGINLKLSKRNNLKLRYLKSHKSPELFELYSQFYFKGDISPWITPSFYGNINLESEILNRYSLIYSMNTDLVNFELNPSYEIVKNKIGWEKKYSAHWERVNRDQVDYFSIKSKLQFTLSENVGLNISHRYNSESEKTYTPEHKLNFNLSYNLPIKATFNIEGYFQSEVTKWNILPDYANWLPRFADNFTFNYDTPSFFIMNLTWKQKLPVILGINNIEFAIRCENILNRKVRYLPGSCEFPRNLTFNLFFTL